MGFRSGAYATVWEVTSVSPSMTKGRISTSRKNRETGEYEQDFSSPVLFLGSAAAAKALQLKEKDRIRLGDVEVCNRYDAEAGRKYWDLKVFSFDVVNDAGSTRSSSPDIASEDLTPEDDANLPF